MPRRIPDILQIIMLPPRPQTPLRRNRRPRRRRLKPQKDILKLHHPRISKQQSRIIRRHQRRRLDERMPAVPKELNKPVTNIRRFHGAYSTSPPLPPSVAWRPAKSAPRLMIIHQPDRLHISINVGPTNANPRPFKSFDNRRDPSVSAGASAEAPQRFRLGRPSANRQT